MGFMVLLLLSLNLLSMTELTVGKQKETLALARANALLGLNVAMGELQRTLGPDQRISATAGVVNSVAANAHWTGAWKSNATGGGVDRSGDFLGWLVSLPQGVSATNLALANNASVDASEWVELVGEETVDDSAHFVVAGKVDTGDNGSYAWWVGDEGVKARVNLPARITEDPALPDEGEANLMRNLLSPSHYGLQKIGTSGEAEGPLAEVDPNADRLADIIDFKQLSLVSENNDVGREYFHDLSLNSRGLLTNTRSGGLKYDLTHLFESDEAFKRQFGEDPSGSWDSRYIFTPPDAVLSFDYGAPNWGIMRDFYKHHEKVSDNSIPAFISYSNATTGTHEGKISTDYLTTAGYRAYENSANVYHINSPVHPLLSWHQLTFWLEYVLEEEGANYVYRPRLHIRPRIAVYNPYDIHLQGREYHTYTVLSPVFELKVGNQNTVRVRLNELNRVNRLRLAIPADKADFRPGETRFYGLSGASYPLSSAVGTSPNYLTDDDDATASYYVDLSRLFVDNPGSADYAGVLEATQVGPTAAEWHADKHASGSQYWGLTPDERQDVTYVRPMADTDETLHPYPWVRFGVKFEYDNVGGDPGNKDAGGLLDFRFGNNTNLSAMLMNRHFRMRDPELLPEEDEVEDDIRNFGSNTEVFWFGIGMRTLDSSQSPKYLRQFIDSNPRFITASMEQEGFRENIGNHAIISGWTGASGGASNSGGSGWLENWSGPDYIHTDESADGRFVGHFGHSRDSGGSESVILYHVPREAPHSLGLFQHAALGRFSRHQNYVVGNSYAPPRIDPGQTQTASSKGYVYDWSYAVNLELWDKYFLSTIPQDLGASLLNEYLAGKRTLPNPRLRLTTVDGATPTVADLTDAEQDNTATNVAKYLMLEGAFNINSVSVEAWKALLASSIGMDIPTYSPTTGAFNQGEPEGSSGAVFYRTPYNFADGANTNDTSSKVWNSYRRLSNQELNNLATEIVKEVQERGPFGSLADFINRRPGGVGDHRLHGALQAALDKTINKNLAVKGASSNELDTTVHSNAKNYTTADDNVMGAGAPGWLLQGDLLQTIGPLLSARSDTFIIRAYGDVTDNKGNSLSRAWCEAVVQRVADKVDAAEPVAEAGPADGYGRRFAITSFRWIDAP